MRKVAVPAVIPLLLLGACGGGGSSDLGTTSPTSPTQVIAGAAPNVVTLEVDAGPAALASPALNTAYVTITVCQPGSTTNCETIPDIAVDTGSSGLRLVYGALSPSFAATLPQQLAGTVAVAECTSFAIGYSWGSVRSADVTISGETASDIPIQMIGDPAFPNVPTSCSSNVPDEEDTVASFGANGILGVGQFVSDCGDYCAQGAVPGYYYTCASNGASCTPVVQPTNLQVSNPVAAFTADNNGVIIELPPVSDSGALSATGALVFGIGTESNNGLNGATVLTSDPSSGEISASFNSASYPESYLDSGSNAFYFVDSSLPLCGQSPEEVFCPSTTQSFSAQLSGTNGASVTTGFDVGNAEALLNDNPSATAFPDLGIPNSNMLGFDFGLPFFYGRNVFTAIAGASTPSGTGPYFAY
ncbi:MAG: DUF3443 domain-containing protein [Steroidobacteraceae bacterium]